MKGTAFICLLLTLILVLMSVQTYVLWQKTQTLETALACALHDIAAMEENTRSIAGMSEILSGIFSRLTQENGLLSLLIQP